MNVATRIKIEKRIVRKLIRTMKAKGWDAYAVNDGEEFYRGLKTEKAVLEHAFAVDECSIYFENKSLPFVGKDGTKDCVGHHVYLVFGNDGWDVICDYSYNAADDFDKIMQEEIDPYTEAIADEYN